MSHSRLAALILLLTTAAASAAVRVSCPRLIMTAEGATHPLSDAKVFQGPASAQTELRPVHGSYDIGETRSKGRGDPFNLVCTYEGTQDTQTLEVPKAATTCNVADAGSGTVAGCR